MDSQSKTFEYIPVLVENYMVASSVKGYLERFFCDYLESQGNNNKGILK